jgi:hypothetical protein
MTPEQIAEIRQQAGVNFLQKMWEAATQLGMAHAADSAHAQAELVEANKKIAELESKNVPVDNAKTSE